MKEYRITSPDYWAEWPVGELARVMTLLADYCQTHYPPEAGVTVHEIRKDDLEREDDKNNRIDVEIRYMENGVPYQQKLLIMKGEVIDGVEFHKRFREYYPGQAAEEVS